MVLADRPDTVNNIGAGVDEHWYGIDIGAARCVVVKSRGHFRAGFDEYFAPDQVFEVDTPGLTSPILANFPWKRLPRPVFPLDPDARWQEPEWA